MNEQNEQRDELHEKLCAYVLGEASEAERTEVEAALEASPELRAERARLEATIGFVQSNLGEGSEAGLADQLSPAASAALLAAAEKKLAPPALPSVRRHWYSSPVLKMAAGIGAIGLTVFLVQRSNEGDTSHFAYGIFGDSAPSTRVAKAELEEEALEAQGHLDALGYTDSASAPSKSDNRRQAGARELAQPASEPAPLDGDTLERLRSFGYAGGGKAVRGSDFDQNAAVAGEVKKLERSRPGRAGEERLKDRVTVLSEAARDVPRAEAVRGLGYAEAAGTEVVVYDGPAAAGPVSPGGAPVVSPPHAFPPIAQQPYVDKSAPTDSKTELQAGAVVTGSDDFFLGFGEKEEVTGADFEGDGDLRGNVADLYALEDGAEQPEMLNELRELGYLGDEARSRRFSGRLDAGETAQVRLQRRLDFVLGSCQRRPNERPRDMFFRFWGDNPFQYTVIDGLSTFAVDVDTASYALARRYLADSTLPEKAQIRTEEFVNYFDADVPAPLEETFAIATELAPSRFGEAGGDSWMLRVAVRGKDVTREERQPLTLTFVIDVSGSMKEDGRLELVKHALRLLMGELDGRDSIAIVAFSNEARVILPMTSARKRSLIETALYQLQPNGGTNAEAGLMLGYELARADLTRNSHNRVVLLSDGVANIGRTDQASLTAAVAQHTDAGIYLNTVGVGMGNHNDALLEQLADKGDGVCHYVDDEAEARRALVERFTGAFEPIARDVKIQVEFDPTQVQRYRLLGYENRAIADRDFRNDAVDAGEVNAGHQVVALYELSGMAPANADGPLAPLATVRLRWKPPHAAGIASPDTEVASETEHRVHWSGAAGSFAATSAGYRRSVLVGQFAEFLRRSQHARVDSLDELLAEAEKLAREMQDPDVVEFSDMVKRSRHLILAERARRDDLSRALESIRETCYLQAQLEDLNLLMGHDRLFELEEAVRQLQQRIRFLQERVQAAEFSLDRAELRSYELENARLAARIRELLRQLSLEVKQR